MRRPVPVRSLPAVLLTAVLVAAPAPAGAGVRETVKRFESGASEVTVDCFAPTARGKHPMVILLHGSGVLQGGTHDGFQGVARGLAANHARPMES